MRREKAFMIALLQSVQQASVVVGNETCARIGRGILAFVGFEAGDQAEVLEPFLQRIVSYRMFPDAAGRMNLSLREIAGDLLLVPQFTLAAQTDRGLRPSLAHALAPGLAAPLFAEITARARALGFRSESGRFGAHMQVHLINDGPVTFLLRQSPSLTN